MQHAIQAGDAYQTIPFSIRYRIVGDATAVSDSMKPT